LPVCISVDDERFEVRASSVLNDPLLEFAATAEALAGSGAVRSEVQLWLEPETLNILFACSPASSMVRVTMRASAFIRDEHGIPLEEYVLDRLAVARSIVQALRHVEGQFHGDESMRGWGSFPASMLRAALLSLEGRQPP
jgi:hypothetical protein